MTIRPTKPLSSYFLFLRDLKDKTLVVDNPTAKPPGQIWVELPVETQEYYKLKAAAEIERHRVEMQKFFEDHPEELEKEMAAKQAARGRRQLMSQTNKTAQRFMEMTDLVMFSLGIILKQEGLRNTPKIKGLINERFEKLSEQEKEKLQTGFARMSVQYYAAALNYYDDWFTVKRIVKKEEGVQKEEEPNDYYK